MTDIKTGSVVLSLKGSDAGKVMMVIGQYENRLIVADGKKRRLASPKRKNPCHLRVLSSQDAPSSVYAELTDGVIRRLLAPYRTSLTDN